MKLRTNSGRTWHWGNSWNRTLSSSPSNGIAVQRLVRCNCWLDGSPYTTIHWGSVSLTRSFAIRTDNRTFPPPERNSKFIVSPGSTHEGPMPNPQSPGRLVHSFPSHHSLFTSGLDPLEYTQTLFGVLLIRRPILFPSTLSDTSNLKPPCD